MWPGGRAAQYMFVIALGFNGFVLFVLIGGLYEGELRRALLPPWPRPSTWYRRRKSIRPVAGAARAEGREAIELDELGTSRHSGHSGFSAARPPVDEVAAVGDKNKIRKRRDKYKADAPGEKNRQTVAGSSSSGVSGASSSRSAASGLSTVCLVRSFLS